MVATRTSEPPKSRGRDRRDHAPEISGDGAARGHAHGARYMDCRTEHALHSLVELMCTPVCLDLCASSVCSHI